MAYMPRIFKWNLIIKPFDEVKPSHIQTSDIWWQTNWLKVFQVILVLGLSHILWGNELLGGGLASPSALCIIHKIMRGLFNIMVQVLHSKVQEEKNV